MLSHNREDSNHYPLQCPNYKLLYIPTKCDVRKVKTITKTKNIAPQHLLNGYKKLSVNDNMNIIQAVCDFILSTKRLHIGKKLFLACVFCYFKTDVK